MQPQAPIQPDTPTPQTERATPLPIGSTESGLNVGTPKKNQKRRFLYLVLGLVGLLLAALVSVVVWYNVELAAVDSSRAELVSVTIAPNTSPREIAAVLKAEGVIRNTEAFALYTRISKTQNSLQAGKYRLSPADTTPEIVAHLIKGSADTFNLTFLPGATLAENRTVLLKAGFNDQQIDTAFTGTYISPLFEGKSSGQDLEGYIYGETYNFLSSASVEDILERVFAEYERVVEENDLITLYKAQGLSLYQGITLASIIQRESIGGDEAQIAQVFYSRLALGMPLGSDVTYQYIADKTGVPRDTNLDSPYNTRIKTGLTPGPIAVPGLNALLAVANPAAGDYLYFLSGDDDITYYGRTLSDHEANIAAHCKVKCTII
jgi:UPF0755 protein